MKRLFIGILLFLLSFGYCIEYGNNVGDQALRFKLNDLDKKEFVLKDKNDKNVLLVFFATWCPPCKKEIPILKELQKKYNDKLDIVAVNITFSDKEKNVRKLVSKNDIEYMVLLDKKGDVSDMYGVRAVPTNILISKNGVIKYRNYYVPEDIEKMLD